jgi:hypothetical protein
MTSVAHGVQHLSDRVVWLPVIMNDYAGDNESETDSAVQRNLLRQVRS